VDGGFPPEVANAVTVTSFSEPSTTTIAPGGQVSAAAGSQAALPVLALLVGLVG